MKRDLDVIRRLLLEIEKLPGYRTPMSKLVSDDLPADVVAHHLMILRDSGYIEITATRAEGLPARLF